jgi:predicted nucleic acid-binding protein
MTSTFLDTSFFLALALSDDALHQVALRWQEHVTGELVTTEFVLLEVADDLSLPHLRQFAAAIFALVHSDQQFTVIPINRDDFKKGYDLFVNRPDKEWGLTDCISFHVMLDRGITDALTHDHHFEQAGFRALLRGDPPSN